MERLETIDKRIHDSIILRYPGIGSQSRPANKEATKLAHPYRGLKPNLQEKLWSLKPNSWDGFLQKIKWYQEINHPSMTTRMVDGSGREPGTENRTERIDRIEKNHERTDRDRRGEERSKDFQTAGMDCKSREAVIPVLEQHALPQQNRLRYHGA